MVKVVGILALLALGGGLAYVATKAESVESKPGSTAWLPSDAGSARVKPETIETAIAEAKKRGTGLQAGFYIRREANMSKPAGPVGEVAAWGDVISIGTDANGERYFDVQIQNYVVAAAAKDWPKDLPAYGTIARIKERHLVGFGWKAT